MALIVHIDRVLGCLFFVGFGVLFVSTFHKHWVEMKADYRAWREKRRLLKLQAPSKKGLHK